MDKVLTAVEQAHEQVNSCRDADWELLGEKLLTTIFQSKDYADAGFTPAQISAIIAACKETFYAATIVGQAYAFKAAETLRRTDG